ncbi:hypothetical protein BD414DRAFT_495077 [Trametes punicea]|nr:hypothetical protein BD414DRAFT_495077 [Trametes punicea]
MLDMRLPVSSVGGNILARKPCASSRGRERARQGHTRTEVRSCFCLSYLCCFCLLILVPGESYNVLSTIYLVAALYLYATIATAHLSLPKTDSGFRSMGA